MQHTNLISPHADEMRKSEEELMNLENDDELPEEDDAEHFQSEDEIALVNCGTTKGNLELRLVREWSPHGYDRAVALFERGFYDRSHFFRVVPNFLVQFGISYSKDEDLQHLAHRTIPDDPPLRGDKAVAFEPGIVSFAGGGDNSRTSQLFITYKGGTNLGKEKWETPIGKVIGGTMESAYSFYSYGDMPPWGNGPVQQKIRNLGAAYIEGEFPQSDRFAECTVRRQSPGSADHHLHPKHGHHLGHHIADQVRRKAEHLEHLGAAAKHRADKTEPSHMVSYICVVALLCYLLVKFAVGAPKKNKKNK